jgi:signal transduction histidine kinase
VRLQPSRSIPGSGLGLSLVAAVTRLHDGSVTLEDNEPGLRIRLTLKKNLPATEAAKPVDAPGLLSHAT